MIRKPSKGGINSSRNSKDSVTVKKELVPASLGSNKKPGIQPANEQECSPSRAVRRSLWHEICSVLQVQETDAVRAAIGNSVVEDNETLFREMLALEEILLYVNESTRQAFSHSHPVDPVIRNILPSALKKPDAKLSRGGSEISSPKKLHSKDQDLSIGKKYGPSTPDSGRPSQSITSPLRRMCTGYISSTQPNGSLDGPMDIPNTLWQCNTSEGSVRKGDEKPPVLLISSTDGCKQKIIAVNDAKLSGQPDSTKHPHLDVPAKPSICGETRNEFASSLCPFDPCLLVEDVKSQLNVFDIDEVKAKLRDAFAAEHILLLNDVENLRAILDESTEVYSSVRNTPRTSTEPLKESEKKLGTSLLPGNTKRNPSLQVARDSVRKPEEKMHSKSVQRPTSDPQLPWTTKRPERKPHMGTPLSQNIQRAVPVPSSLSAKDATTRSADKSTAVFSQLNGERAPSSVSVKVHGTYRRLPSPQRWSSPRPPTTQNKERKHQPTEAVARPKVATPSIIKRTI